MYCPRSGGDSVGSAGTAHGSKPGSSIPLTDSRRLPGGWFAVETDRDDRTARAVVSPTDFLLIQLPGARAPWLSSGAEALAALDRALAVDARKPVGLALGSGLEGALDLAAVTTTLTSAWQENFKQGSVIVSDGKAHGGARWAVSAIAHRRGQSQAGSRGLGLRFLRSPSESISGLWRGRGQPRSAAACSRRPLDRGWPR